MTKNYTALDISSTGNTYFDMANLVNQIVGFIANEALSSNNAPGGGAMSAGNGFNLGIFGANTLVGNLLRGGNVTSTTTLYLGSNVDANGFTYICGNLISNATTVLIGNSTVYSWINQTTQAATDKTANSTGSVNSTVLFVGNTVANAFINSTSFYVGSAAANAQINSSGIFFGGVSLAATLPAITNTTSGLGTFVIDSFALAQYRACEYTLTANDLANPNNYQISKVLVLHNGGGAFTTEYALVVSNSSVGIWSATTNSSSAILQFTPVSSSCKVTGTKNLILI